jgi:hypothetical protein
MDFPSFWARGHESEGLETPLKRAGGSLALAHARYQGLAYVYQPLIDLLIRLTH